jgi:hypothetical protein
VSHVQSLIVVRFVDVRIHEGVDESKAKEPNAIATVYQ